MPKFGRDTPMARKERYLCFYRAVPKPLVDKFRHAVSVGLLHQMVGRSIQGWWQDDGYIPTPGAGFVRGIPDFPMFLPFEDQRALVYGQHIVEDA